MFRGGGGGEGKGVSRYKKVSSNIKTKAMFRRVGGKKCRPNKIKAVFSQASCNCYSFNYRECGLADMLHM